MTYMLAPADAGRVARGLSAVLRTALYEIHGRVYWESAGKWRARGGDILLSATVHALASRHLVDLVADTSGRRKLQPTTLGRDVLEELERRA